MGCSWIFALSFDPPRHKIEQRPGPSAQSGTVPPSGNTKACFGSPLDLLPVLGLPGLVPLFRMPFVHELLPGAHRLLIPSFQIGVIFYAMGTQSPPCHISFKHLPQSYPPPIAQAELQGHRPLLRPAFLCRLPFRFRCPSAPDFVRRPR